jgi:hypothetical protein
MGVEGRLTDGSATYEAGSARQLFSTLTFSPHRDVSLGVTAYVPLESGLPARVLGTGIVTF